MSRERRAECGSQGSKKAFRHVLRHLEVIDKSQVKADRHVVREDTPVGKSRRGGGMPFPETAYGVIIAVRR